MVTIYFLHFKTNLTETKIDDLFYIYILSKLYYKFIMTKKFDFLFLNHTFSLPVKSHEYVYIMYLVGTRQFCYRVIFSVVFFHGIIFSGVFFGDSISGVIYYANH